ncbi:phosphorylase family protein [Mycolicibacterium elephantis]|uniref:phosphorylase family protein n=1 Tax=Mycolicibacterium elephantis TaxID=81858 RepID=UPI0009ED5ED9|nr:hypothetical protein [Mycolicibacterium elephantis]
MVDGRAGHARVVILGVTPLESEVQNEEFGADTEVMSEGVFAPRATLNCTTADGKPCLPLILAVCTDRSNGPAQETAMHLLERWKPEYIILCGTAGGILRREERPQRQPRLVGPVPGDVVVGEFIHYADYGKKLQGHEFKHRYLPVVHPPTRLTKKHTQKLTSFPYEWPERVLKHHPKYRRRNGVSVVGSTPVIHRGEIVAVEAVAGDPLDSKQQWLVSHFDKALAVDMESHGVARALHDNEMGVHYRPSWLCVRGISDPVVGSDEDLQLLKKNKNNERERRKWERYAASAAAHVARVITERILATPRPPHPQQIGAPAWKAN